MESNSHHLEHLRHEQRDREAISKLSEISERLRLLVIVLLVEAGGSLGNIGIKLAGEESKSGSAPAAEIVVESKSSTEVLEYVRNPRKTRSRTNVL